MPTENKGIKPLVCDWTTGLCMIAQVCMNHQKGTDRELMETASKMGKQVDGICKAYNEKVDELREAIELLKEIGPHPDGIGLGAAKIREFLAKHNEVE